jgi:ATP-dependent DNA helicase RecG
VFNNLALAVIDEQHRFGVQQRALLAENHAHVMAMTATPIPRSLALTIYGDQDLSIIGEKPAGRKEIITRIVAESKVEIQCYRFIDDQVIKGRQIFWVCPLVDESDAIEAKNVLAEYVRINEQLFPHHRVEYLHGKMKPKEKDAIMQRFKNHEFDILVSTSVIEVGVDIPNSTVMVIENSERFGLAQLHQFRGRIGRNDYQSYCFLMVGDKKDKSKERLKAMEASNDGFYLSEIDLKLRGSGEVYGLKQSGLPDLKCADFTDVEAMQNARDWATKILEKDLTLESYPRLKRRIESETVYF